jgi:hypothetical protein
MPVHRLIFRPSERMYNSLSFIVKRPNTVSIAPKTTNKSPMGILISMSISTSYQKIIVKTILIAPIITAITTGFSYHTIPGSS